MSMSFRGSRDQGAFCVVRLLWRPVKFHPTKSVRFVSDFDTFSYNLGGKVLQFETISSAYRGYPAVCPNMHYMSVEDVVKENIRGVRKSKRWSIQIAADRLGWTKSKYARFERPGNGISVNDFFHVCEVFGVGITTLAGATTLPQRQSIERLEILIKKEEGKVEELREILGMIDPRRRDP